MTAARPRAVAVGLLACAALALGGCASLSNDAQDSSIEALTTQEPPPRDGPKSGKETHACHVAPFASLPPSALPPAGHMPAGSFMKRIHDQGYLRAGVDQNTLRLGRFDPASRRMEGLDIDLVREVAHAIFGRDLRKRIRYKAISTGQRDAAIVYGQVDLVASAYTVTCERRTLMLFSSVYYVTRQHLLVNDNSPISSVFDPDARGKKVCATKTSTTLKRLVKLKRATGIEPLGVTLRVDCLVLLQEGAVDAISADDPILLGFKDQDPQTKFVGPSLRCEHYAMAINKAHPDFVRFVNGVLARLRRYRLAQIRHKWLKGLEAAGGGGSCS
jgi:polar amino acid transport system substrate-binding protein